LVADAELLQRVVRRDSTALVELERRHQTSLYAQAYAIVMDSMLADRVVGEVFAQLWYAAGRFVMRRTLWSWLRERAKELARAELMLQEPRYSQYSSSLRRDHEAHTVAHPGAGARAGTRSRTDGGAREVGNDSELPRVRYRQSESGGGDGTPRDACAW
jgi:DNA-directed RNA polymerase specialized sigma24 family protein